SAKRAKANIPSRRMDMIQRRLIDEAAKTTERTATTTDGIRQQAAEKADAMKARATEAALAAREQISDQAEAGLSGVGTLVEEFGTDLPVLREAGYTVRGIQIHMGLPPKMIADFSCGADLSEAAADELAARYEDRRLAIVLMRSLRQAQRLQSSVRLAGL